jgi:hypothetical protein
VSEQTHYHKFQHPNEIVPKVRETQSSDDDAKTCSDFINIFDEKILKPIFVYKYKVRKHQPDIDYEGVLKEVQEYERDQIKETE